MVRTVRKTGNPIHVAIPAGDVNLAGILLVPERAKGFVAFVHGAGSNHQSPRNQRVAEVLQQASLGTLLVDLLTEQEDKTDVIVRNLSFNVPFLAARIEAITDWIVAQETIQGLPLGYFGASTGAAAALTVAARRPQTVGAMVSRGGRVDLTEGDLASITTPTLLLVGEYDHPVLDINKQANQQLQAEHDLVIVPGAGHLFEEPSKLEEVAEHASSWFTRYLGEAHRNSRG